MDDNEIKHDILGSNVGFLIYIYILKSLSAPVFPECTELAEPGMPAADNCVKLSASSSSPRQSGERSGGKCIAISGVILTWFHSVPF